MYHIYSQSHTSFLSPNIFIDFLPVRCITTQITKIVKITQLMTATQFPKVHYFLLLLRSIHCSGETAISLACLDAAWCARELM